MNDLFIANIMSVIIFGLLYVTFLLTPKMSRKDLIFGVFIPLDRARDRELIRISKRYSKDLTVFTFLELLIYFILVNTLFKNPGILAAALFVSIAGYFLIFLKAYRKTKKYKMENNLLADKKQVVLINTSMSVKIRNRAVISIIWFIVPMIIALVNFILPLVKYEELPSRIATHWNISGTADSFIDKSFGAVVAHGLVPAALVIIMGVSNFSIAVSKNRFDASRPVSSANKLFKFKKINSILIYSMTVIIISLITGLNLNSMNIISLNMAGFTPFFIILTLLMIFIPIGIDVKMGQGGHRLKDNEEEMTDDTIINKDDDDCWKLGSIYYNPNDPSLFVEKRFGVGWTLNYGNKAAIVITVLFIVFIISICIFPLIFS
ncbi:MAG: DUF5808 domain-containing protein [Clostridiaceae bacterium]